uniref:NIN-like protein n=1 Tax=Steinernema glaseri TaxID=37863 RepID=A0A1I7ZRH1_9BILA
MDKVSRLFIQEVILQLDHEANTMKWLSTTWGQIAKSRWLKEEVRLNVYSTDDSEPVFSFNSTITNYRMPVDLDDMDEFIIRKIAIKGVKEETNATPFFNPGCLPLTEKNLNLLREHLSYGWPVKVGVQEHKEHHLVQQLCLVPARVTDLAIDSMESFKMEALTRNVERGTLRSFHCFSHLNITQDLLSVLWKIVASEKMKGLLLFVSQSCPFYYETILADIVDAFLSTERRERFTFEVCSRGKRVCEPLRKAWSVAEVEYDTNRRHYDKDSVICIRQVKWDF